MIIFSGFLYEKWVATTEAQKKEEAEKTNKLMNANSGESCIFDGDSQDE